VTQCTNTVRVVKVGTLCCEVSELAGISYQVKHELGVGGGSTVALIDGSTRILVDTGFDYESVNTKINNTRNARSLAMALKLMGIKTDDIDAVFVTHWHRDHFGNLGVFDKAEHLASKGLVERFRLKGFRSVIDGETILPGVEVLLTPGHTIDHASIIVNSMLGGLKARIAVAGDAVLSHGYLQSGRVWQYNADFHNAEEASESIQHLLELSDVIIPGHGTPFMAPRPFHVQR
jgi:glyoxylase-like metal-dependent hydrolase (beta-lactamase superfamily II)